MQETEDAGKDSDQTIDYIIVDGKKVHFMMNREESIILRQEDMEILMIIKNSQITLLSIINIEKL